MPCLMAIRAEMTWKDLLKYSKENEVKERQTMTSLIIYHNRAVAMSENLGGGAHSTVVGIICPLVEIGLTVWPKKNIPPQLAKALHIILHCRRNVWKSVGGVWGASGNPRFSRGRENRTSPCPPGCDGPIS